MDATARLDFIRRLVDEARYEEALTSITQGAGRWSDDSIASLKREIYMKLGELHRALGEANRLRTLEPSKARNDSARRLLGRIIETDVRWLPDTPQIDYTPGSNGRRILHLLKECTPYSETGFTMRSRMTLSSQKLAGLDPQVITSLGFPRNKGISDFPDNQLIEGILHHHLDLGPGVDTRAIPFDAAITESARLAGPVVAMMQPQLIQAGTGYRGFETALLGIALARKLDVPVIYEVRGFQEHTWTGDIARSERGEYYRRRMRQEARCMSDADSVITIGEAMAAELALRGVNPSKLHVVPNAVDANRFTPRPKRSDLVEEYGLHDRFVVGYVSNLGAREGIGHLLKAVSLLRKKHPEIKCLIAGDGPERPALDQLIDELDISDYVVMVGHVPNKIIEDHFALIDLFVVPRVDDRAAR
ncbi:MAG: glycosyltransferase, partial [Acidimicrobiia bacterium]